MVSTCYTQENIYNTNPNWQDVINPTVLSYKLVRGGGKGGRETMCAPACTCAKAHTYRSKDNLHDSVLFFHCMRFRNQIQIVRLSNKCCSL